ncbi:MAG: DoxX family protein [Minisyncoccia bacterium]|jgi:uncharacterized membrane protein YphA (DoxX/SURF4 family)
MTNLFSKIQPYGAVILRLGMGLVFVCFSYYQFRNPSMWTSFVPQSVSGLLGGNATMLVLLNAWFELVAGLMLIAGFQVRTVSLLLAAHLFGIAGTIGISPLGVRDLGLSIATFSVFLAGPDIWSLDRYFLNKVDMKAPPSSAPAIRLPVRRI